MARAEREAATRDASLSFGVADMRALASQVDGEFDVVLACDNALPHLLEDDDLRQAVDNMFAKLRPGGLFLASIRDYDRLVQERPRGEGPRVVDGIRGRRIAFQVWDWTDDGSSYRLHQFMLRQDGAAWHGSLQRHLPSPTTAGPGRCPAPRRVPLAGIHWHEPEESGFFQPIVHRVQGGGGVMDDG